MLTRLCLGLASALLMTTLLPFTTADASTDRAAKRGVTLKASAKEVEEGDRLTLTAKIKGAASATKVTLQRRSIPIYGDPEWVDVKSKAVKGKKRVKFRVVATSENSETYRARVIYKDGKTIASKSVLLRIWRWIALSSYQPYYEAAAGYFSNVSINGHTYAGYYTYGSGPSWEERFTAGRNCKAFRAVLGLQDKSHDGSTGAVKLTAEESVVYESPMLTPGMDVTVVQPLDNPYRFGFQLFDTSGGDLDAWPALGEPALLCTGVG